MYVILDRALPHIGDGLKPVQRRIIYAMSELGFGAGAEAQEVRAHGRRRDRQVSSARRLGVLRSDGADGAAVLVPLSDRRRPGQLGLAGRSEVVRGDALHRIAAHALRRRCCSPSSSRARSTGRRTSTARSRSRLLLPARLPNVLLNGATGIAVGMATDIPPHNLREVANACIHLLDEPDATLAQLIEHVQGPDFRPAARSSRRATKSARSTRPATAACARARGTRSRTARS